MNEEWRDVLGFEGRYQVSDQGRVRSVERLIAVKSRSGLTYYRRQPAKILRASPDSDGYFALSLWKENKGYPRKVHRLVAEAFVEWRDGATDVNHDDGNKMNNRSTNLQWTTHKENSEHAARNDLMAHGERHGVAKLRADQIPVIREALLRKESLRSIAQQFNVCVATINDIAKGRTWRRA